MKNNNFKRQREELKKAIKQVTELLPPEYAKISLRLFAENILGKMINLSADLPYEETVQEITKLILAEIKRTADTETETNSEAEPTETEKPESVKTKRVQKALMPVDKISKTLFNPAKNAVFYDEEKSKVERVPVYVGDDDSKVPVNVFVSINIEELLSKIQMRKEVILDPDNRAVHDAICSIYAAGNRYFTADMIFRLKRGTPRGKQVAREETIKSIEASILKLWLTHITIDTSEEEQAYGIKINSHEGNLLDLEAKEIILNNQRVKCYHFLREPVLLEYARKKNQIAECDAEFLALPFSATDENIRIRDYLFQEISHMKHNRKYPHVITYAKIYAYLQVDAPTEASLETKCRRIRDKVRAILDAWKEPYKGKCFIYDYKQEKTNGVISGVRIFVTKPKKQQENKAENND